MLQKLSHQEKTCRRCTGKRPATPKSTATRIPRPQANHRERCLDRTGCCASRGWAGFPDSQFRSMAHIPWNRRTPLSLTLRALTEPHSDPSPERQRRGSHPSLTLRALIERSGSNRTVPRQSPERERRGAHPSLTLRALQVAPVPAALLLLQRRCPQVDGMRPFACCLDGYHLIRLDPLHVEIVREDSRARFEFLQLGNQSDV